MSAPNSKFFFLNISYRSSVGSIVAAAAALRMQASRSFSLLLLRRESKGGIFEESIGLWTLEGNVAAVGGQTF